MIKNIDEARFILYDLMEQVDGDGEYPNGGSNAIIFYYDEILEPTKFKSVSFLKQSLKKDLLNTECNNRMGWCSDEELRDLKTMFNALFS